MELFRALAALAEPPTEEHGRLAELLGLPPAPDASTHADVFLMQLPPYASVYVGGEGMLGGEALDRVAGFWRALRQEPPDEPDHLSSLLGLAANLAGAEARESDVASARLLRNTRAALLWEHLLPWMPPFLQRVEEVGGPFYGSWATLLQAALRAEIGSLGALDVSPRHLAESEGLADPRQEGAEAFLASLLAPVRSGFILLRCDLSRLAQELELGLRTGDRSFVLKGLLSQSPDLVLSWLARRARLAANEHEIRLLGLGPIRAHWVGRANATADLLTSLAAEARAGVPA